MSDFDPTRHAAWNDEPEEGYEQVPIAPTLIDRAAFPDRPALRSDVVPGTVTVVIPWDDEWIALWMDYAGEIVSASRFTTGMQLIESWPLAS